MAPARAAGFRLVFPLGFRAGDARVASLCSDTREASIDATSAITRLSVQNLILRGSGSGKALTKDQGDSIDLENSKGR